MSGRTWIVMLVILALNWGGFAAALAYGIRRETGKRPPSPREGKGSG